MNRVFPVVALLLVLVRPGFTAPQTPDVDSVRKAAQAYAQKYLTMVSGVGLDEILILNNTSGGTQNAPERINADMLLVNFGGILTGLRDPYAVDTKKLRDHQPRVAQALAKPTQENVDLAQKYVREHAAYLGHNLVVWYTDPVLSMQFLMPDNEKKLTFAVEGSKKFGGVQCVGLTFKEAADGPHVLDQIPGNAQSRGKIWVDPATGTVYQTELQVQSDTDVVQVQIVFAQDKALGWVLPSKSSFNLVWREFGNRFNSTVGGGNQKISFEGNAEYSKATYSKIDLNAR
jgi:hypothetical protein